MNEEICENCEEGYDDKSGYIYCLRADCHFDKNYSCADFFKKTTISDIIKEEKIRTTKIMLSLNIIVILLGLLCIENHSNSITGYLVIASGITGVIFNIIGGSD